MATFNDFCASVKSGLQKGFKKFSVGVEKAADTASLHIKLNTVKVKLAEHYEELGKLTYEKVHNDTAEDVERRVEVLIVMIEGRLAEQQMLREELDRRRTQKGGEETEYEATAEAPAEESSEAPAEEPAPAAEEAPAEETAE